MKKPVKYRIGDHVFATKGEIEDLCREARDRAGEGNAVEGDDLAFLLALFAHHDEWDEKSGPGVQAIVVVRSDHGTVGFDIRRVDGTSIDISFRHAVKRIPNGRAGSCTDQRLLDFRAAARTAVRGQVNAYRDAHLTATSRCPESGVPLHRGNTHVDHGPSPSFDELLHRFCRKKRVNPRDVLVGSIGRGRAVFEDHELARRWTKYHGKHASLRLLSENANLRRTRSSVPWDELLAELDAAKRESRS